MKVEIIFLIIMMGNVVMPYDSTLYSKDSCDFFTKNRAYDIYRPMKYNGKKFKI